MRIGSAFAAFAFIFMFLSSAVQADMSWTEVRRSELLIEGKAVKREEAQTRIKLKSGGIRIEDTGEGRVRLCNFSNRTCVDYDKAGDSFDVFSQYDVRRDNLKEEREREQSARLKMKRLSEMSDHEKAEAGAELDGLEKKRLARGLVLNFEPAGEVVEIENQSCRKYTAKAGRDSYYEVWIAEEIQAGQLFSEYKKFLMSSDSNNYRYLGYLPGFPIKTVIHFGPLVDTIVIKDFSEERAPVSDFLLPKGAVESR